MAFLIETFAIAQKPRTQFCKVSVALSLELLSLPITHRFNFFLAAAGPNSNFPRHQIKGNPHSKFASARDSATFQPDVFHVFHKN